MIPASRELPPFFSTADEGSFARQTLMRRKPAIVDQVIDANRYTGEPRDALLSLKEEIVSGTVDDLRSSRPALARAMGEECAEAWRRELLPRAGRSWLSLPFYFAEALFYLRILVATGFFDEGSPLFGSDPFLPFKLRELHGSGGGLERGRKVAASRGANFGETVLPLVFSSLWGNRVDLSLFAIAERSRGRDVFERSERLLVDHSDRLVDRLSRAERVDFVLDNSGQELVSDLLLASALLASGASVRLHAKGHPFYVSDATEGDVRDTIRALEGDGDPALAGAGRALGAGLEEGRLAVRGHCFWNGPLHFPDMPRALGDDLSRSGLVILKGDVNYRRLLSDRRWEPWTRMEDVAAYFPAPFAVLRTMKSESVVDIPRSRAEELDREDASWRVNGERGMIRVVGAGGAGSTR